MPPELLSLADLLASGHSPTERSPDLPHEGQIARLRDFLPQFQRPNPFKVGDLVTPIRGGNYNQEGAPHIVIEVAEVPQRDWNEQASSCTYGSAFDIRVARMGGDKVVCFWVESYGFERYSGN